MSGDLVISSTTDDAEQVQAALDAEPAEPEVGEITTDSTSEVNEGAEPAAPEHSRPDRKLLKRIDKLTAQRYAEVAAREAAEAREADLQRRLAQYESTQEAPDEDPEPTTQAAEQQRNVDQRDRQILEAHFSRISEATKDLTPQEHQDLAQAAQDARIPTACQLAMLGMETSADLTLHLLNHPEVQQKLCEIQDRINPAAAVAYLGKIANQLEFPQNGNGRVISRAPKPIRPVSGGMTRSSVPLDELDYQNYKRIRAQQEREEERG